MLYRVLRNLLGESDVQKVHRKWRYENRSHFITSGQHRVKNGSSARQKKKMDAQGISVLYGMRLSEGNVNRILHFTEGQQVRVRFQNEQSKKGDIPSNTVNVIIHFFFYLLSRNAVIGLKKIKIQMSRRMGKVAGQSCTDRRTCACLTFVSVIVSTC